MALPWTGDIRTEPSSMPPVPAISGVVGVVGAAGGRAVFLGAAFFCAALGAGSACFWITCTGGS
jgi:hypothetical protein